MNSWLCTFCLAALLPTALGAAASSTNSASSPTNQMYAVVVRALEQGQLKPDSNGIAVLPIEMGSASAGREIFVRRTTNGLLLVAFKLWRGKGYNMIGYMHSSRPLTPQDKGKDHDGNDVILVGPRYLKIERQVSDQWFSASYQLD